MKYTYILKGITQNDAREDLLQKNIEKLDKYFINFPKSKIELSVVLKKHERNTFYSCTIKLILPKKTLIVNCGGHKIEEIFHEGIEKLERMIETYKETHFSGDSKYPDRKTIRGSVIQEIII